MGQTGRLTWTFGSEMLACSSRQVLDQRKRRDNMSNGFRSQPWNVLSVSEVVVFVTAYSVVVLGRA